MRLFLWVCALTTFVAGLLGTPNTDSGNWVIVVAGNTQGYLSPCGCTKPMHGGIRRRVSATKAAVMLNGERGNSLVLETGSLSKGVDRQDELKLDALADALAEAAVDVVAVSHDDLLLGESRLNAFGRLSKAPLISGYQVQNAGGMRESFQKGPFTVGCEPGDEVWNLARATRYASELCDKESATILVTHGGLARAQEIAKAEPRIVCIIYRSTSQIALAPVREGNTWIISPGHEGKAAIRLEFNGRRMENYSVLDLGPETPDDSRTSALYRRYLDRVRAERLLERVPRTSDTQYVGTKSCASCHEKEYTTWNSSKHAQALATLEKDGHDADPDCVGCHVVGLDSPSGFVARERTPELANVGCESCHVGGAEHSARPAEKPMPAVGANSCTPCHNLAHSPTFDFESYWKKIAH